MSLPFACPLRSGKPQPGSCMSHPCQPGYYSGRRSLYPSQEQTGPIQGVYSSLFPTPPLCPLQKWLCYGQKGCFWWRPSHFLFKQHRDKTTSFQWGACPDPSSSWRILKGIHPLPKWLFLHCLIWDSDHIKEKDCQYPHPADEETKARRGQRGHLRVPRLSSTLHS